MKNIIIIDDSKGQSFKGLNTTYIDELKKNLDKKKDQNILKLNKIHKFNVTKFGGEYYTTIDMFNELEKFKKSKPDIIIINLGINDCSPRLLSQKWKNRLMKLPKPMAFFIRIKILRRFRKLWWLILKKRLLVNEEEYKLNILKIVDNFKDKKIILMNIAPTNKQLENKLPGISYNILLFNRKLLEIYKERGDKRNVSIIDIFSIINKLDPQKALIDGCHYMDKTSKIIALKLADEIIIN